MRIAVISDTHGRHANVKAALDLIRERGLSVVIHCGDIDDEATVRLLAGFTAHFVFGNTDRDRDELSHAITQIGAKLHKRYGHLELEGRKIAWTHGDDQLLMHDIEFSGHYDFLFYGHTHEAEQHRTGPTLVVNPGALHRARVKTFVVLDLETGEIESVVV